MPRNLRKHEVEQIRGDLFHKLEILMEALESPINNLEWIDDEEPLIESMKRVNHIGGQLQVISAGILSQLEGEE